MNPVRLTDAIRLAERNPDMPIPLVPRQGKCEKMGRSIPCGVPARWWVRNEMRCDFHKDS